MKVYVILLCSLLFFGAGCTTKSNSSYNTDVKSCSDIEPSNPYQSGSGHYAGFEWGEKGKTCGGNSSSFINGCEEYERQENTYQNCLNK